MGRWQGEAEPSLKGKPWWIGTGLVAAVYYAAAVFGMKFVALPPGNLTVVWLPSGIGIGALILGGRALWPGIVLASFAANMPHFLQDQTWTAIAKGVGVGALVAGLDGAQALIGHWFFRRHIGADIFSSRRATLKYYGLLAVLTPVLTVWLLVLLPYVAGFFPATAEEIFIRICAVTLADMLGIILVLPLVFAFCSLRGRRVEVRPMLWVGVLGLVLAGLCHAAFYGLSLLVYASIPVLFVLTLKGRNVGFTLGMTILSFYSVRATSLGLGPFVEARDYLSFVHLFVFIVSIALLFSFQLAASHEMETAQADVEARNRELNELTHTLELRIDEKTRDLTAAKARADAANEAKSVFLANISHEIRTPLNGVVGMTDALLATSLDGDQRDYVETIEQCSALLLDLINQVLDLAKIESGEFTLKERPFDLPRLMKDMAASYAPRARRKGLDFQVRWPEGMPVWWHGDPTRLRQILENLLSNGLKFTERGHLRLALELDEAVAGGIHPPQSSGSRVRLRFSVSDTGPGIAPEHQARLFEKFYQVDGSLTRVHQGSGLGLAIVRQLARLMHGEVHLESGPGAGSAFHVDVELALAEEARDPEPDTAPVAAEAPPRLKILVAEDNLVNQRVLMLMLNKLGHEVTPVSTGQEVLQCLRTTAFDVILMDIQMPEMDGLAATREIRRPESGFVCGRDIPIIALTAHALPEDRQRAADAGMNGYLTKPVTTGALSAALSRLSGLDSR